MTWTEAERIFAARRRPRQHVSVTVDLIASGDDWECPGCWKTNHVMKRQAQVKCRFCRRAWEVGETYHADA